MTLQSLSEADVASTKCPICGNVTYHTGNNIECVMRIIFYFYIKHMSVCLLLLQLQYCDGGMKPISSDSFQQVSSGRIPHFAINHCKCVHYTLFWHVSYRPTKIAVWVPAEQTGPQPIAYKKMRFPERLRTDKCKTLTWVSRTLHTPLTARSKSASENIYM